MTPTSEQATESRPVSGAQRSQSCFIRVFLLLVRGSSRRYVAAALEIVGGLGDLCVSRSADLWAHAGSADRLMTRRSAASTLDVVPARLLRLGGFRIAPVRFDLVLAAVACSPVRARGLVRQRQRTGAARGRDRRAADGEHGRCAPPVSRRLRVSQPL